MQNTAQGWLVYQLTGSKVLLGTVAAVGSLPMLLLSVWGGSVADRHSKRNVVFFAQTGMMLLAFVFAALVGSGGIQPWHILVLACMVVGGWGMLLYFATTNTLIQTSVSDAMRGRVMGIWALVFGGMMPVGGVESGLLSQAVGVPWTIAVGALVCAAAGLVTWWLEHRNPEMIPVESRAQ